MKTASLCLVMLTVIVSCDHENDLPVTPSIRFDSIEFMESNGTEPEQLVLSFFFEDGDGDLGLSSEELDPPYQISNYQYDDHGRLLTLRSRSDPKYSFLPPYEAPYNCTHYTDPRQTFYYPASEVDASFHITDTTLVEGVTYYGVADTIYFEPNEDHYNIEVDFLVKKSSDVFEEFDWRTEYCNQTFDGRFPPLQDGTTALEGRLQYTMTSIGFRTIFGASTLKLRFSIKDRALHRSNTVYTNEFTL